MGTGCVAVGMMVLLMGMGVPDAARGAELSMLPARARLPARALVVRNTPVDPFRVLADRIDHLIDQVVRVTIRLGWYHQRIGVLLSHLEAAHDHLMQGQSARAKQDLTRFAKRLHYHLDRGDLPPHSADALLVEARRVRTRLEKTPLRASGGTE